MSRNYRFCPVCGAPLGRRLDGDHERLVCTSCDFVFYQNPAAAAGVILMDGDRVLLVRRRFEPRKGLWTLPAGFVEWSEHPRDCAVREMKEETNLDVELTGLFGAYSAMDDPRTNVVLLLYTADRTGGDVRPGDDAEAAEFFGLDALPDGIAFRAHAQALDELKQRRRGTNL